MSNILFWAGALIVFTMLRPFLKLLIAVVAGKQIGEIALSQQPDEIHLQRSAPEAWKDPAAARSLENEFTSNGFRDAGVHTVTEMPGLIVQLLANEADAFTAAIYQHPKAGIWFDVFTRYQDGTSVTFSTSRPTALKPRPGHDSVNLHGASAGQVLEKARAQRPRRAFLPATTQGAVAAFEQAYAESIAYRKQVGVSTGEVVRTATRKVA